jgi:hypothetical protein
LPLAYFNRRKSHAGGAAAQLLVHERHQAVAGAFVALAPGLEEGS